MEEQGIRFEDRFVAYIDILGWSAESSSCTAKVVEAITHIHDLAAAFSANEKSKMKERLQKQDVKSVNPLWLDHQVGAFSDNIVISNAKAGGARIIGSAAAVQQRLLQIGFLCRGGISFGPVYHRDAVVMGPALIEAVNMEKQAVKPRIVVSQLALDAMRAVHDIQSDAVFVDGSGVTVVNPIPTPAMFANDAEAMFRQWLDMDTIENAIKDGLRSSAGNSGHLEKWEYMDGVIREMFQRSLKLARG